MTGILTQKVAMAYFDQSQNIRLAFNVEVSINDGIGVGTAELFVAIVVRE